MKDKTLAWLTFLLSLVVGAAGAFSTDPADVKKLRYPFLETSTGRTFEAEIPGRSRLSFERLLVQDPALLGDESRKALPGPQLPEFYLLTPLERLNVMPYAVKFARGFVFVWLIYLLMRSLVNILVVQEFRKSVKKGRRRRRRQK
ncbi:MAG: hypothetical protein FGM27_03060 [Candidatus Omnitrophica bacterium]|nr:hypothetical protein [Candidatus Omnitrophota bacterium]